MLEEINVHNLGVIEEAHIEFTGGLNALTGETGAGKSLILGSLGLLLGKKGDTSLVRSGADSTNVEGIWNVSGLQIADKISETGAAIEDGEIFINRTVSKDGKNRLTVGGKATPVSILAEYGEELVTIHGQADQMRLKNPVVHREMLDRFGGEILANALNEYQTAYSTWRQLNAKIKEIKTNSVAREREIDELTRAVEEITKWQPQLNEDDGLIAEITMLANVEQLQEATGKSLALISNDSEEPDVSSFLALIVSELEKVSEFDPKVKEFYDKTLTVYTTVSELTSELTSYLDSVDTDALQRLNESQERLAGLQSLKRRYGPELDDVINYWKEAETKLTELNPENNNLEILEVELSGLTAKLRTSGTTLTELRSKYAKELEQAVNIELAGLAMSGNELLVGLNPTDKFTFTGKEEVEFLMSTPGNSNPRPIHKAASGGELSRIMLALSLVADDATVPTVLLDEVDSGIGGSTAIEIGKRLARLAKHKQVIVVSHLAQVAAFADNAIVLEKAQGSKGLQNITTVRQLNESERVGEITRMLSGLRDSETGKAHAEELLAEAKAYKITL